MKIAKFVGLLLLAIGGTWFANTNNPLGLQVPPLGKMLNPFTGIWQNGVEERFDDVLLEHSSLSAPVRIVYGERQVPHVFAENAKDALFAQGYLHARHRWWQMNLASRSAEGRISEITGPGSVGYDKRQRRLGLAYAAENAVKKWQEDPEGYALLESYVAGVNSVAVGMKERDRSLLFKIMDFEPEPWSVYRTALMIKNMAQTLASRYDDLEATNSLRNFGNETFQFLYPEWNPKQRPIIPAGTSWSYLRGVQVDTQRVIKTLRPGDLGALPERPDEGIGSNNWAVAGSRTKSGYAMLAGDPHLSLSLPSIWFELQMKTQDYNVYGVSVPGIPTVLIGFNEHIAWTETNVGHDVLDLYELDWTDDTHTAYRWNGEVRPVTYRVENLAVRGDDAVIDSVRYTHLGPIVSNDPKSAYYMLAARWVPHMAPVAAEMTTFQKLNEAKDYGDYSEALTNYVSPAQNFAFASTDGDIAIKVNGRLPRKQNQEGRFIKKVDSDDDLWQEFIPMSDVPQVRNPDRGYISSANQHSTDPSYPYYYNGGFSDYRGRIINERLDSLMDATPQDMMALQQNNYGLRAAEALPLLLERVDRSSLTTVQRGLLEILEEWDYRYDRSAVAPAIFEEWWKQFYRMTWDEIFDEEGTALLYPEAWRTIELLDEHPQMVFWDIRATSERETVTDIVTKSLRETATQLDTNLDDNDFNWGSYNAPTVRSMARIPAFGRTNLPISGHRNSPNAMNGSFGPSWRMVVELGEPVRAWGIYPGGTSEDPGDASYDHMVEPWARGEYYELEFMRELPE